MASLLDKKYFDDALSLADGVKQMLEANSHGIDFSNELSWIDDHLKADIFRNLDSQHDGLSRRITICQLTMKLHDFGRSALPDYDFDKTTSTEKQSLDIFSKDESTNKEGGSEPELHGF